jgi:hypothetical protein
LIAELEACFVAIDSAGQKLAYVYYEEEPGRRSAAKLLSKDAARRIAANIRVTRSKRLDCLRLYASCASQADLSHMANGYLASTFE